MDICVFFFSVPDLDLYFKNVNTQVQLQSSQQRKTNKAVSNSFLLQNIDYSYNNSLYLDRSLLYTVAII